MTDKLQKSAIQASYVPSVRDVEVGDILTALRAGLADFLAAPLFGFFFGSICAAGGLLIVASLTLFDMSWMIIPVAIGFPLVGPFIAVGLYEVSRRRAAGEPLNWRDVILAIVRQRERQFGFIGIVILCIFWIWIFIARILFALFLGSKSFTGFLGFFEIVTTTVHGLGFLAIGSAIGAILAFVLFASTVISLPLLVDRDIDVITAMITSFNTVYKSPVAMIAWGALTVLLAIIAMIPAFLGLIVVFPVLGHTTWHLYKKAIVGEDG